MFGSLSLVPLLTVGSPAVVPPFYPDKLHLLVYAGADGRMHPISDASDLQVRGEWRIRRGHILANMLQVMGGLPEAVRPVPLDVQVSEEVKLPGCIRRKITYAADAGNRVPAYLFLPDGLTGKAPAVLCLHQTIAIGKAEPAGLGGSPNLHYALELAQRGYVTLAPDYPRFGDNAYDPYAHGYASATLNGIWNHIRAVDLLQSLPEVDGERIGCIGHSLGGHNTLFVTAFDERIKVAVTSCGFTSFAKYYGGDLTGWSHAGYMPRIAERYHKNPAEMPFDFSEILAAIAPRRVFINAPVHDANFEVSGVDDCVRAAGEVYRLLGAEGNLVVQHPDCQHDFPPATREAAYEFIDRALDHQPRM